jgi:hypothetical protein
MMGCTVVAPAFVLDRKPTPPEISGASCAFAFNPHNNIGRRRTRAHLAKERVDLSFDCSAKSRTVIGRFTIGHRLSVAHGSAVTKEFALCKNFVKALLYLSICRNALLLQTI